MTHTEATPQPPASMQEAAILRRQGLAAGTPPLVALRGIAKSFPGVLANSDVDLDVYPGEIHALLGENGAGKSTLMNVLTGIYAPDAGEILVDGYARAFTAPQDAIAAGIGMVHQHFKLVEAFTVAENVHLGWTRTPALIAAAALEARTARLAARLNLAVRPDARVADLTTGEQQRVEILRVLARQARLLILDEPTAVLTPAEARDLFASLRRFVTGGGAVIFISHKLDEVMEVCDRVTVLRSGRRVATAWTRSCTQAELARLMVGREIVRSGARARVGGGGVGDGDATGGAGGGASRAPAALALTDVSVRRRDGGTALAGITVAVHAGEILGIAGVAGNGQRELSQVMTGLRRPDAGRIRLGDADVTGAGPARFVALGAGHIPEDRLQSGLAPDLSVRDNAILREYGSPQVSPGGWLLPRAAGRLAAAIAGAAQVRVPDMGMAVRNLSGGNQQRLVAQREMRIAHRVLVAAYPSRGLDVGAIDTMLGYLGDMRRSGTAVVLFSEDLEELLSVADRLAVLFAGRIMGETAVDGVDLARIGMMMGGHAAREAA